jgi:SAM-dependent methyltransferase
VAAEEWAHLAPVTDDEGRELARMLDGYIAAQVTRAIALSGVPDQLDAGPRTAAELAAPGGAAADQLGRLLTAATMFGLLTQDADGRFALTSLGARLRTGRDGSMYDFAAGFLAPPIWSAWTGLPEIVRTGQPPAAGLWEYFQQHPPDAARFARAMSAVTTEVIAGLVRAGYTPPAAELIVDVGGSRGTLLAFLLGRSPAARGVVFDRAEALTLTPGALAAAGVADRAQTAVGDFLTQVPDGDLHVLSNVTHNWPDEPTRRIFGNCYRASRPGGGLLLLGMLLPAAPRTSAANLMDLLMMVLLGGRERTLEQFRALAAAEGWAYTRHVPLSDDLAWHAVEFRRD